VQNKSKNVGNLYHFKEKRTKHYKLTDFDID